MADPLKQAKQMAAYNNQLALSNAKQAQSFNAQEAQKNRDWQERMSNSAHQREIADLKKAGLNPVLSITGGNGASTTSGATASGQAAEVDTSLTRGILDMAISQMNNATSLQRVMMETQNAMAIATMNNERSWLEHITPGGSTPYGQAVYGLKQADEFLRNNSKRRNKSFKVVDKEVAKWDYYDRYGKFPTDKQLEDYTAKKTLKINKPYNYLDNTPLEKLRKRIKKYLSKNAKKPKYSFNQLR